MSPVTDNQIHEVGFPYDGNGNLASDGVKDYLYDELNHQVEVRQTVANCAAAGQGTGSFSSTANAGEGGTPVNLLCYGKGPLIEKNVYGPDGMRAVREVYAPVTNLPKRTTYARLGGNVVKEYTEEYRAITSTAPEISHEKAYVYGPLGLLATEELCSFNCKSDESAGINVTRYYELDHLGTIRAISDSIGHLVSTSDYEPFGLELKSASFSWWTDSSSNTHKFTGHERDEEAGEDYMRARMYVLSTARFPQIDPSGLSLRALQTWNPYIYVVNSPVGMNDPTGKKDEKANKASSGANTLNLFITSGAGSMTISVTLKSKNGGPDLTVTANSAEELKQKVDEASNGSVSVNVTSGDKVTNNAINTSLHQTNAATIIVGHSRMSSETRASDGAKVDHTFGVMTQDGYLGAQGFYSNETKTSSGPVHTSNSMIALFTCDSANVNIPFVSDREGGTLLLRMGSGADHFSQINFMGNAAASAAENLVKGENRDTIIGRATAAYAHWTGSYDDNGRRQNYDFTPANNDGDHVVGTTISQSFMSGSGGW